MASYDRNETVTGAYAQYTYNLNDQLILLGGIRADYSSQYGFFVTPRFHVKFTPTDQVHIRGSIGKGFRTAHVLAENNYLLASSRRINIADDLDQEEAWNTGFNATLYIPISDNQLTITGEWYYTRFLQQVVVDVDSDPHAISFYNLDDGKSYSQSAQIELSYPFFDGFTLTAAYRYTRSKSDYRNIETGESRFLSKPLMNDYKGLITASYQTPLKKLAIRCDSPAQRRRTNAHSGCNHTFVEGSIRFVYSSKCPNYQVLSELVGISRSGKFV